MCNQFRFKINKLIRDKLPEIISINSAKIFTKVMKKDECITRLNDKLIEEASEVINSQTKEELIEELADLFEVMFSIAKIHGIDFEQIQEIQKQKKLEFGGFDGMIYADFVEMKRDNPKVQYYILNKDKYPEIK